MFAQKLRRPAAVLAAAVAVGVAAAPTAGAATATAPGAPTVGGVVASPGGVIASKNDGRFKKSSEAQKKIDNCNDMFYDIQILRDLATAREKAGDAKGADNAWKSMDAMANDWDSAGCGR
jgi:hypothetical protein